MKDNKLEDNIFLKFLNKRNFESGFKNLSENKLSTFSDINSFKENIQNENVNNINMNVSFLEISTKLNFSQTTKKSYMPTESVFEEFLKKDASKVLKNESNQIINNENSIFSTKKENLLKESLFTSVSTNKKSMWNNGNSNSKNALTFNIKDKTNNFEYTEKSKNSDFSDKYDENNNFRENKKTDSFGMNPKKNLLEVFGNSNHNSNSNIRFNSNTNSCSREEMEIYDNQQECPNKNKIYKSDNLCNFSNISKVSNNSNSNCIINPNFNSEKKEKSSESQLENSLNQLNLNFLNLQSNLMEVMNKTDKNSNLYQTIEKILLEYENENSVLQYVVNLEKNVEILKIKLNCLLSIANDKNENYKMENSVGKTPIKILSSSKENLEMYSNNINNYKYFNQNTIRINNTIEPVTATAKKNNSDILNSINYNSHTNHKYSIVDDNKLNEFSFCEENMNDNEILKKNLGNKNSKITTNINHKEIDNQFVKNNTSINQSLNENLENSIDIAYIYKKELDKLKEDYITLQSDKIALEDYIKLLENCKNDNQILLEENYFLKNNLAEMKEKFDYNKYEISNLQNKLNETDKISERIKQNFSMLQNSKNLIESEKIKLKSINNDLSARYTALEKNFNELFLNNNEKNIQVKVLSEKLIIQESVIDDLKFTINDLHFQNDELNATIDFFKTISSCNCQKILFNEKNLIDKEDDKENDKNLENEEIYQFQPTTFNENKKELILDSLMTFDENHNFNDSCEHNNFKIREILNQNNNEYNLTNNDEENNLNKSLVKVDKNNFISITSNSFIFSKENDLQLNCSNLKVSNSLKKNNLRAFKYNRKNKGKCINKKFTKIKKSYNTNTSINIFDENKIDKSININLKSINQLNLDIEKINNKVDEDFNLNNSNNKLNTGEFDVLNYFDNISMFIPLSVVDKITIIPKELNNEFNEELSVLNTSYNNNFLKSNKFNQSINDTWRGIDFVKLKTPINNENRNMTINTCLDLKDQMNSYKIFCKYGSKLLKYNDANIIRSSKNEIAISNKVGNFFSKIYFFFQSKFYNQDNSKKKNFSK